MKENEKLVVVGVVIAALIIFLALFVYWSYSPMMRSGQQDQNGSGTMGDIDRHFIEQMVPHHEEAVAMADIALTKAEHPEIKQLAGNIKSSQSREITKMRRWYKSWYGTDVPTSGMMGSKNGMMQGNMMSA
ncbi:MAG: DUF305 domain-containing protein [Euryarchaeota archaeon]|nr:DUF305 domain-containing protein [Euryarchaeota archaeon]MBV1729540.1 DUF305 domain-containing protein [Methanobacterium sp.]MBV1755190.1 DUF305 domain-containing protein [Methanobacterium sp.]MBV1768208.1 DUF305 domain-containing protein [Methanobacterium sp.]